MMLFSIVFILLTAGISLFLSWLYVFQVARRESITFSEIKTLLVLGKKLVNDLPDSEFISRLKRAEFMLIESDADNIYILGGETQNSDVSEASSGKKILVDKGIDPKHIIIEEESRNTLENLKNFSTIADIKDKYVPLITNRYHLARSLLMAKSFGINAQACAAEPSFIYEPTYIIKTFIEAFYLHWYLTGKYWASLTNNKKMLDRIS